MTDAGPNQPPTEAPSPPSPEAPPHGLAAALLDPRSLQMLMACGGGLLVVGLVIWLWTVGVFENRYVVAGVLGGVNLATLAAGATLVRRTAYQTAGRAITLLACLILPLNLWLYDAQGIVTLADGGRLWIPALVICVLYALVARLLRDPIFVYALVGGGTMTGLLFLADNRVGHFWEVISPSTLLVVIGVLCVHAERLFAPGEGPFTRGGFGRAFFRAGHAALAAGLMVLLTGRIVGWLYEPLLAAFVSFEIPDVATRAGVKLTALALALSAAYTYFYSQLVVDRGGRYAYSAILTLLWCQIIGLDLLAVRMTEQLMVAVLASTALATNAAGRLFRRQAGEAAAGSAGGSDAASLARVASATGVLGALFVGLALILGVVQFFRGVLVIAPPLDFRLGWGYTGSMLAVALASGVGAAGYGDRRRSRLAAFAAEAAVVAVLFAFAGGLLAAGLAPLAVMLPVFGLAPLGMMIASRRSRADWRAEALAGAAQLGAAIVMMIGAAVLAGFGPAATGAIGQVAPLLLGAAFAEAAVVFALATLRASGDATAAVLAAVACWAAAWQWLAQAGMTEHGPLLASSLVGLVGVVGGRVIGKTRPGAEPAERAMALGAAMTILGGAAGVLLTAGRLLAGDGEWRLLALMLGQAVAAAAAGVACRSPHLRRGLAVVAGANATLGLLVVNALSALTLGQKLEVGLTAVGAAMLVAGHLGWRRESRQGFVTADSLVSFNLAVGSLLAACPAVLGLLDQRLGGGQGWAWVMAHEVGVLGAGLVLLGLGVLCRIRWTTLVGGSTLLLYLASLVLLVSIPHRLQNVAVYLMVGGAAFFATAVLLSVFRDRLLSTPERIRKGEGVFRVLHWR